MDHIPTEVLHEIFIKLVLKDKIKCMLVSRLWYDTLDRHSLLHKLDIPDQKYVRLKEMLERQPHRAAQVEYLSIYPSSSLVFDKRVLCNMFPNLREIKLSLDIYAPATTNYLDSPFQFNHARSKLEKIEDAGECELTRQLAMSNMCSNLKEIELTCDENSNDILSQLKNMPVLEILSLRHFDLTLMELEMVHYNIPSIKSLSIRYAHVRFGEFPTGVIPAMLMTKLDVQLSEADDIHTHIRFYKKDNDYVRDVYNKGILPLYQSIGSKTNRFSFNNFSDGLDAFRKLDESGIKLKQLTLYCVANNKPLFIEELAQSQQSKHIQKLILNCVAPDPLDMMIHMEALTYLEINFRTSSSIPINPVTTTINFNRLMKACPATLTHLITKGINFKFSEPTSHMTSIQYLKLLDLEITEKTAITWTSFPELSYLYLKPTVSGDLTISLPNNHLKEVTLHIKYPGGEKCGLSVQVMNDGQLQRSVLWPDWDGGIGGRFWDSNTCNSRSDASIMVHFSCTSVKLLEYTIAEMDYGGDYSDAYGDDSDDE